MSVEQDLERMRNELLADPAAHVGKTVIQEYQLASLLKSLKTAVYYLEEIHGGNVYSDEHLWKVIQAFRGLISEVEKP